jgi:nitroimidazol reductase NimA-like FMN-containing flavoprotein (pyridoxamine 5'-phosphate oxidase superfamily)
LVAVSAVPLERRDDYIITMYELDEDVCRQMLTRCTFGRIAFDDPSEGVSILPVNCVVAEDAVLFRCQAGTALDRLGDGLAVAFEADGTDPIAESGWSVMVRGTAHHVTSAERIAGLADTVVHPWAPGRRDRWIEIRPRRMTGRIIKRCRMPGPHPLPSLPPD